MNSGVLIYLITPLLSAISQLILKKAADNPGYKGVRAYLNWQVIVAYGLFFGCMLLNVVALRTLDLTIASVLEASGYTGDNFKDVLDQARGDYYARFA
jgi:hypothetical protein